MKIYAITPSFDDIHLARIDKFFEMGHEFLQLRDKTADLDKTTNFVQKVLEVSDKYSHAKIILNASNNFEYFDTTILEEFNLFGIQQSTSAKKSSENFCPSGKFNILSCHNKTDLNFAIAFGFMAATLSPVFRTQSHPEQIETLGVESFSRICSNSRIPVFALGGITIENSTQFKSVRGCSGVAMIRGWFG